MDAPSDTTSNTRRRFREAVLCLFFLGVALGASEWLLGFTDIQPILYEDDPYVGFSSRIPLFVPETQEDGTSRFVTAQNKLKYFNPQQFPAKKPENTFRIFCVGDSVTYGRPYEDATSYCGWLREMLREADPSRNWEVINAGGISYASYRVAMLMEEMLDYEPDLFIVCTGHNEFLEQRTYGKMISTPPFLRWLESTVEATRTFTVVSKVIDPVGNRPESIRNTNSTLDGEVKAVLDDVVGLEAYTRDDELREQISEHFEHSLRRIIEIAESVDTPIFLVSLTSNMRDVSPFKSEYSIDLGQEERARAQALLDEAKLRYAEENWKDGLKAAEAALEIEKRHAGLYFIRGKLLWELGQFESARESFLRAQDEDICPLRATTPIRDAIVSIAERENVPLVDFAAMIEDRAPHAAPGNDDFFDHCHPLIDNSKRLALEILDVMESVDLVRPTGAWGDEAIAAVSRKIESQVDEAAHATALRNLAKVLNWAGKSAEAYEVAIRVTEVLPEDGPAHFEAGSAAMGLGLTELAAEHYLRSVTVAPNYARAHNNLGDAYKKLGRPDLALQHFEQAIRIRPDYANAYNNAGSIYREAGYLDRATENFRRSIEIDPDNARALNNLGLTLQAQGRLDEALASIKRAIEIRPTFLEARNNLGNVYQSLGNAGAAIREFDAILRMRPDFAPANFGKGSILRGMGKPERAIQHLEWAARSRPDFAMAHHELGLAYKEAGRLEPAIERFEKAVELDPSRPLPLNDLARMLATHPDAAVRDSKRAIELAARASELLQHGDPEVLDTLACAYAEAGDFDRAVKTTDIALSLARSTGADRLVRTLERRKRLFESQTPYREP